FFRGGLGQANYWRGTMMKRRQLTQAQQEIRERKRAEAALEAERALLARCVEERTADLNAFNTELERVVRLKDEFLASMSHELHIPLNAILGMSEALQEQVYGPLNEKQMSSLHSIEENGRHLLSLINDILDLSKIETGKLELEVGLVSVESVCQASLRFIRQDAYKKRLVVNFSCDEAVTTIWADERRLKQVLVNLLSNAVKFTPNGGEIGLEVSGDQAGQAVSFTVWDTGIGIAPGEMRRLFQPFVQLDSRPSRHYTGTGLGLSLVYRMTEMHGGGVAVASQVAQGSRFTVTFPWTLNQKAEKEGDRATGLSTTTHALLDRLTTSSPPQHATILLAEDNEASIAVLNDYLAARGYRVLVARNGQEAVERTVEARPDVILMDIQMPGLDGLEAIRRIRSYKEFADSIPIITLTALVMPGDRERCLAAGANAYMSKPVPLRELVAMIEAQLERVKA
ncbi:MAG: ATP-binding protein, partial [Chloroflexi bacterium]|nr:ATP-binding protein [Chloroflexota bacterium]